LPGREVTDSLAAPRGCCHDRDSRAFRSPASVGWEVPRAFARVHPPHHARKIREQIKTGTFPIRLKGEDWQSGEINWLLDVIAPDAKATGQVIANFRQVAKEGDLRVHPLVAGLVDAEMRD
jgi:hypothetical protein